MVRLIVFLLFLFCSILGYSKTYLFGVMEQGALIRGQSDGAKKVLLNGKSIKVSPSGVFVFGFSRDAELTQSLTVINQSGQKEVIELSLEKKKYNIQRIEGISKRITSPSTKSVTRASVDSAEIKKARQVNSNYRAFNGPFNWPLKGPITGVYGSQRFYNGKPGSIHYGVDVAAKTGTVVVAPATGLVTLATPDMFYSGGTIIIDHGFGVNTTFIHLSKLYLDVGQVVKQDQPIGEVGATGRATGPHLDWRINWFDMRLDPETIVPSMD